MKRRMVQMTKIPPHKGSADLRRMLSTAMPLSEQDRRRLEALRQRKP